MIKKLSIFLVLALAVACHSKKGLHRQNVAHFYYGSEELLQPQYTIYLQDSTQGQIHFQVNSNNLLHKKDENGNFQAHLSFSYQVVRSYEELNILDSGSAEVFHQLAGEEGQLLSGSIAFKLPKNLPDQLLVLVQAYDVNRRFTYVSFLDLFPKDPQHRQYFQIKDASGNLLINPWLKPGQAVQVTYPKDQPNVMQVRAYFRDFPVAMPPYSTETSGTFEYKPDSTFALDLSQPISFAKPGIYHLQYNTKALSGLTFLVMENGFPLITKKEDLAPPLRYLTTKNEYATMMGQTHVDSSKYWVDKFWLKCAGSEERGQRLVAEYYQRVEQANQFFTSYLEGWKTDRGIIYIIFGPPTAVYRSTIGESWVYGEENSSLSYNFNFIRVANPFTDEDYALERMQGYRYGWGQAIEAWRNGHTYNVKDIKREQDERDQQIRNQRPYFWY